MATSAGTFLDRLLHNLTFFLYRRIVSASMTAQRLDELVTPGGREFVYSQFVDAMWNRLRVIDYITQHPEVADEKVDRPLVVLGLPRTGTSLASYLLDQDPCRRSLLTWEAEDSVPP